MVCLQLLSLLLTRYTTVRTGVVAKYEPSHRNKDAHSHGAYRQELDRRIIVSSIELFGIRRNSYVFPSGKLLGFFDLNRDRIPIVRCMFAILCVVPSRLHTPFQVGGWSCVVYCACGREKSELAEV